MPPTIYARNAASGDGWSASYTFSGPAILHERGANDLRAAVQAAVRGAGLQAQRQAIKAYSPPVIQAGWALTTRTVPRIAITVSNTEPLAAYVENETKPHDIPGAFGYKPPFGVGGRFNGKFHPGTPGKHRLPGLLAHLAASFEAQIARRVTPLLQGGSADSTEIA